MTAWTDEELKILKDNYQKIPSPSLHRLLPFHSVASIRKMAQRKGYAAPPYPRWTPKEENRLRRNSNLPMSELKRLFPSHSPDAILDKIKRMGLRHDRRAMRYEREIMENLWELKHSRR